jgi:hypothetical protein
MIEVTTEDHIEWPISAGGRQRVERVRQSSNSGRGLNDLCWSTCIVAIGEPRQRDDALNNRGFV